LRYSFIGANPASIGFVSMAWGNGSMSAGRRQYERFASVAVRSLCDGFGGPAYPREQSRHRVTHSGLKSFVRREFGGKKTSYCPWLSDSSDS
jgi:hypothetical protein